MQKIVPKQKPRQKHSSLKVKLTNTVAMLPVFSRSIQIVLKCIVN